jgi:hypothetical protein
MRIVALRSRAVLRSVAVAEIAGLTQPQAGSVATRMADLIAASVFSSPQLA